MTEMAEFLQMSVEQRGRCKFIPLGDKVYNGLGYCLGNTAWTKEEREEFELWRQQHGVMYDSVVYEFPNRETFVMARLMFE